MEGVIETLGWITAMLILTYSLGSVIVVFALGATKLIEDASDEAYFIVAGGLFFVPLSVIWLVTAFL